MIVLLGLNDRISMAQGFPDSSVGKEAACNEGDLGSVPGSGRSSGEGKGYPLQDSWASLVTQLVKNLSAMWETWVWSLGWEDFLEKGKATHFSILVWKIPWTEEPGGYSSGGCKKLDSTERISTHAQIPGYQLGEDLYSKYIILCLAY